MRRGALAALSLVALLALPVQARTLVVRAQVNASSSIDQLNTEIEGAVLGILAGHAVDVKPFGVVDTTAYLTGYLRDTLTHTGIQYDAIIVTGGCAFGMSTALRDPLAVTHNGSAVPIAIIGPIGNNSGGQWQDGGSPAYCIVGTTANMAAGPTAINYRFYDPVTWKSWGSYGPAFVVLNNLQAAKTWRALVKVGAASYRGANGGGTPNSWRDKVESPTATVDTVALWVEYPATGKPVVFLHHASAVAALSVPLIARALAFLDSAAGRRVFDNTAKLPIRIAPVIGPIFASSKYTQAQYQQTGIFCAADSCDSANVRRAVGDSVRSLGKRITLTAQMDSIGRWSWQKAYFGLLGPLAKYTAMDYAGGEATRASGNASSQRIVDPLGVARTRRLIPAGATGLPCACTAADSSLYCLLKAQKAKRDSLFPADRRDNTLIAPLGSAVWGWGRSITRSNGRTLDSLAWIFWKLGYTAVATDPLDGLLASGAGPWGNPKKSGFLTVYDAPGSAGARAIARLPLVPVRWYEESGAATTFYSSHDYVAEFWRGRFIKPWYLSPLAFYQHDFMHNLYGIMIPTSSLGGAGQGTTPMWPGWQELRRMSIETDGINAYGREIVVWDWMENVAKDIP